MTAAHCLYDDDNEEVLPASSFSLMLGLHDRRKTTELKRLLFHSPNDHDLHWSLLYTRRQIRVTKVLVHENFADSATDIALLRLGKKNIFGDPLYNI